MLQSMGPQRVTYNSVTELEKQNTIFGMIPFISCQSNCGFSDGSAGKSMPAMQETQEMRVQSQGHEDPLEKEMAIHSSILAWKTPRTEEPGRLQSMGWQRVGQD